MTDPRAYLADVLAKADGALRGPWWWSVGGVEANDYDGNPLMIFEREDRHVTTRNDCDFVADARTTSPAMARALIAVVELHHKTTVGFDGGRIVREVCAACHHASQFGVPGQWPCSTVTAITTNLAKEIEHG